MAESFLEEIYQYAKVTSVLRQAVEYIRVEDWHHAHLLLSEYEQALRNACGDCVASEYPEGLNLWQCVQDAYQQADVRVQADLIESTVLPMLEEWIQSLGCIEQQVDQDYQLESTASGFLTVKSLRTGKYLHSNNDPMDEARRQIEYYFVPSVENYAILGCGLGYEAYQLYQVSRGSVKIYLFEPNKNMVEYARKYGVLEWIPQEKLVICTRDSVQGFLKAVDNNKTGAYMHLPSLFELKNDIERNAMVQAFGEFQTPYLHKRDLQINFYRNIQSGAKSIKELSRDRISDEVVIVAAGPSLDSSIETLRAWKGKKTIIAVGTVFRKLVKLGIKPDFVVVMDPQKRTLKQIEGVEGEKVPMLLDVGSYWAFARRYKGEKYFILTPSIYEVMSYAQENRIDVWPSGGTVTALAVEVAIQYNARAIYLMGVDLAYPGGISHASDTLDREKKDIANMIEIPGVRGKQVHTTHVFKIYLQWLEDRIAQTPHIKWYNLSDRGARIAGAVETDMEAGEDKTETVDGKISVIIPCYNVEKYVADCVESLLAQSIGTENLELIFVDDASTDGTYRVLQQYAEKNSSCMKLLRLPQNSRQGTARNVGMKAATGDYIGFVDADDYIERDMYELLYRSLQSTGADLAVCGRYEEYPTGGRIYIGPSEGGLLDLRKAKYKVIELRENAAAGVVQKLFRRSFLEKANVWFPENTTYEDNYFGMVVSFYLETVARINRPLYHYRINLDSTVQKKNSMHHLDRLKIEMLLLEELKRRGLYQNNREEIETCFMERYFANTIATLYRRFDELPEGILLEMQETVREHFPSWRENALLPSYKGGDVRRICELADYPFQKGDKQELSAALEAHGLIGLIQ